MTDLPWDDGVEWFSRRTVAPTELPMTVQHVTSQVLRVANGTVEDAYVSACIAAATDACEKDTGRALMPQTWELILSRFPYGSQGIVIPRLPLLSIDSITYIDEDGTEQTMASSPADYIVIPSGEFRRARVTPLYGATWPATRAQKNAVTVTFQCGCEDNTVPETLLVGIGLMVGEMYKTRTLSADEQSPAMLQVSRFWRKVEG